MKKIVENRRVRSMLVCAAAGAIIALAPLAAHGQTLNFSGDKCSGSAAPEETVTVHAAVTGLSGNYSPVLTIKMAYDVTGESNLVTPDEQNYTVVLSGYDNDMATAQDLGGGRWVYGALTAGSGASATDATLVDMALTLSASASGSVTLTPSGYSEINDNPLTAGTACTITVSEP
ncbi:MAG: hypothetical protein K8I02_06550 [Candidatus Methylomirabilis sp.]|nr:hypothetical protein [Deltaproteobacteria bacterium]